MSSDSTAMVVTARYGVLFSPVGQEERCRIGRSAWAIDLFARRARDANRVRRSLRRRGRNDRHFFRARFRPSWKRKHRDATRHP